VTAPQGLAGKGRALDSSPNSSPSDTIKHRVFNDSSRVRIEVRDESFFRTTSVTTKAKAKNPDNKKQEKTLEFHRRLIEALGFFFVSWRKIQCTAGNYLWTSISCGMAVAGAKAQFSFHPFTARQK
jgi:hypothetical protein